MNEGIYLEDKVQAELRMRGLLNENEVAKKVGDLVIAISAIDNNQRIIGSFASILSENKKILKG